MWFIIVGIKKWKQNAAIQPLATIKNSG